MVIPYPSSSTRCRGSLMVELLVGMSILVGVLVPLGWSLASERQLARALYQRAVAIQIVDGELETLLAGEWRSFAPGKQDYRVTQRAATNLPPGKFILTLDTTSARLEWLPDAKHHGGRVVREGRLK